MIIKDIEAKQGNINLTVEVVEKADTREFEKFGRKGRVCNAVVKDSTGTIKLTLWNEDIDKVNVGDTVKIENGWVSEWQGELQLSTGKFGRIEVIEKELKKDNPSRNDEASEKFNDYDEDKGVEEEFIEDE